MSVPIATGSCIMPLQCGWLLQNVRSIQLAIVSLHISWVWETATLTTSCWPQVESCFTLTSATSWAGIPNPSLHQWSWARRWCVYSRCRLLEQCLLSSSAHLLPFCLLFILLISHLALHVYVHTVMYCIISSRAVSLPCSCHHHSFPPPHFLLLPFSSPSSLLCFSSSSFLSSSSCPATCPTGCRWRQWEEQEVQSTSHSASIATSHSKLWEGEEGLRERVWWEGVVERVWLSEWGSWCGWVGRESPWLNEWGSVSGWVREEVCVECVSVWMSDSTRL